MIPWAKPVYWGNEIAYVKDAVNSTWISGGRYIESLESQFSQIHKTNFAISTSNGTTALTLALLGLGISEGDEVIIPGFCFVAAGNTVLQLKAKPVHADIDPETWNISPEKIREKITPNTKAIMVVHNYGNISDMEEIAKIAKENNLHLIEDVAEAPFSKYNGKYAGTFGDIGCFSFQATKIITTGEGGCIITNSPELDKKMRKIRNHGFVERGRYWHDTIGYNFRLTNLQAAMGVAQLEKIDEIIKNKKRVFNSYKQKLYGLQGITFQKIQENADPVIWAVALKIDCKKFNLSRDELIEKLKEKGIETRPGFSPFHAMPIYQAEHCPIAEEVSKKIIIPPISADLKEEEIEYICNSIKELVN